MGFDQFFNRDGDKVEKYEAMAVTATEEEKREFETSLLVPAALPPYGGEQPTADLMEGMTVRLVFPDEESAAVFCKHVHVTNYVEKSTDDVGMLLALLDLVEEGKIVYDRKTGKAHIRS